MSFYLEAKIDALCDPSQPILESKWSLDNQSRPLLAVVRTNGDLTIVDAEGIAVKEQPIVDGNDHESVIIEWHPNSKILAIGWNSGTISFWTDSGSRLSSIAPAASPVATITWSPSGDKLLVSDKKGSISLYSNRTGQFVPIQTYTIDSALTHSIFISSSQFFVGAANGAIYTADETSSNITQIGTIGSSVREIFYGHRDKIAVVLSIQAVMFVFSMAHNHKPVLNKKVKLSIKGEGSDLIYAWDGNSLLMGANKEPCLRIWSVVSDESLSLPLSDPRHMAKGNDVICNVSYNIKTQTLLAGTILGRIVMWRRKKSQRKEEGLTLTEDQWMCLAPVNTSWESELSLLRLSGTGELIAAAAKGGLSIMTATILHNARAFNVTACQVAADKIIVYTANGKARKISANLRIKGLCVGENTVVVWNEKKIEIFEIADDNTIKFLSSFNCSARCCCVQGQTLFASVESRIDCCNFQGIVKKAFSFSEDEGKAILLDVSGDNLVAVSDQGTMKIWEVGRREAPAIVPGRRLPSDFGVAFDCRMSRTGTHVALLCHRNQATDDVPIDSRLLVYDIELDRFETYDFARKLVLPFQLFWDGFDPNLLSIVAHPKESEEPEPGKTKTLATSFVFALFVTSEHGIQFQDRFEIGDDILIGSETPFTYYIKGQAGMLGAGSLPHIDKRVMRDFVGLEGVDDQTKRDLAKFSLKMAIGDMDEAYHAVRNIDSSSIWKSMAKMCVITRRLDMASICLGNMGFATGARALRECRNEQPEVQLACLAIELGMIEEAATLYSDCGRYDLLIPMYAACEKWEEAFALCEKHHRIMLKTLQYAHGKFLEARGEISKAIAAYEASNSHFTEVPRLYLQLGQLSELERYAEKMNEPKIKVWLGQYNEGRGSFEVALQWYLAANDYISCVRIYCIQGDLDKARNLCKQSGNMAACYQLGRTLELKGEYDEAISLYAQANRFNHALRLAKEQNRIKELYKLALESPPDLQIEAAEYLERQEIFDKAITLYQKAGKLNRALDLCFQTNQFDSLASLTADMGNDTPSELIERCASFFLESQEYEKTVQLYISGRRYKEALEVCINNRLPISDELAESLTPPKDMYFPERNDHLKHLAKYLVSIGSYHMATKKFTQAGDKVRAMKCLLKSNDTSKIIYYATMTKKKEIYMLAANHLQNCDWHSDPEITKTIISFYTKAGAYESLALFYDSCAQKEIDDYRDYDKALLAIKESLKTLESNNAQPSALQQMQRRVYLIEQFIQARTLITQGAATDAIRICVYLTEQDDIENGIREGDVYALMIEYLHGKGDLGQAGALLQRMKQCQLDPRPFIRANVLQDLGENATVEDDQGDFDDIDDDLPE